MSDRDRPNDHYLLFLEVSHEFLISRKMGREVKQSSRTAYQTKWGRIPWTDGWFLLSIFKDTAWKWVITNLSGQYDQHNFYRLATWWKIPSSFHTSLELSLHCSSAVFDSFLSSVEVVNFSTWPLWSPG